MRANDEITLKDEFILIHRNKYGQTLNVRRTKTSFMHRLLVKMGMLHDSMTNIGMSLASNLLGGLGAAAFTYVGIGTDNTAANNAQTGLIAQISRITCTPTQVQTGPANDTLQQDVTFSHATDANLTGTAAVVEVGVFNASGTGANKILWRQVFAAVNVDWDAGDSIECICKTQMKQGT